MFSKPFGPSINKFIVDLDTERSSSYRAHAMEAPTSASQGAMRSLPRKLESLLSGPKHGLRAKERKKLRVLREDLQGLIDNYLIEPSEVVSPALTASSWMKDVRDLSYDIDDFIYELALVCGGGGRISVVQKPPRFKICQFPEKLRRRRWVTDEISRFRTRVKEAIQLHQECLCNCKWRPSSSGQPPPSPCDRLVGVESSIQQLCSWLANDGQHEHRVVSIVGTGGVGKTALAKEVYRKLGGQFECLAFVRTSPKQDLKGLLTSLLWQVRRGRHLRDDVLDVQKLVININAHLRDKTYLIVIEDLWALSTWDLVNCALPKGNYCSRILTTTEVDVIAKTCCADNSKYIPPKKEDNSKYTSSEKLDKPRYMPSKKENNFKYIMKKEPLSEDESRELFSNRAFGKQAECPQGLKEVSNEIIKRSGGLPLGINILASLLAPNPASSIEQWNYISNLLSSHLTTHSSFEKINQVLNIGYDYLPHDLKTCMLYLCLYEEDRVIWKDDLVKQWIAEGFISVVTGGDKENVAHSYFGELVNRGLIQPVDTNCSDEIISCSVHHMVHHFIRSKSMEDNFCIAVDHSQTTIRLADNVRRLGLHFGNVEDATPPGPESMRLSKVRSVAFSGFHKCMPSIVEFRFLQVLNLKLLVDPGRMMSHSLTGFDELSGNLSESGITSIPDGLSYNLTEISELLLLRYFHLDACHMSVALPTKMQQLKDLVAWEIDAVVTAVPSDIVDLSGLQYLRIPSETHLPTGIGRLTTLRTLGVVDISKNSTEDVMRLGELINLHNLRLTCSTLQPDNLEKNLECLGLVIRKLSNLKCVTLVPAVSSHVNTQHNGGASSIRTSWDSFSIGLLLQKLELSWRCCHFSSLPEWTKELTNLCILKIGIWKVSNEDVIILKGLPSLTALSLFIWTAPSVRIVFDNVGFLVLKYFKFVCAAPSLEFLDGAIPSVRKLKLGFNANRLDVVGFERLTGLNEISIKIGDTGVVEGNRKSATSVLTDAISMHPSTPIINVQWVDWVFSGADDKHIEPRKEIWDQTSEEQNVTSVESSDLLFEKEAKCLASALIDEHNLVESSDKHGIQEKNLKEEAKKQLDIRAHAAPESTFHLQNTYGVAEKHEIDSGGYGEIEKNVHTKMVGPWGGDGGSSWEINVAPLCLTSITIKSGRHVYSLEFSYIDEYGVLHHVGPWGGLCPYFNDGVLDTIKLGPSEFLTGISGTIGLPHTTQYMDPVLNSLTFITNTRQYGPFGALRGPLFRSPPMISNSTIVGFFGRSGDIVDAIGIYVNGDTEPMAIQDLITKVGLWGNDSGSDDDGVHTRTRHSVSSTSSAMRGGTHKGRPMGSAVRKIIKGAFLKPQKALTRERPRQGAGQIWDNLGRFARTKDVTESVPSSFQRSNEVDEHGK